MVDRQLAELELGELTAVGPGAAAHAKARAVRRGIGRDEPVGVQERAPETKAAVATGVDFELCLDRGAVRKADGSIDDGGAAREGERKDFTGAGVMVTVRLAEGEGLVLGIDLDHKTFEEPGAKNAVAPARAGLP